MPGDRIAGGNALFDESTAFLVHRTETAAQFLLEHLTATRGDVRDFSDKIGIDALNEVCKIEIDIVGRASELRRVVVSERFRRKIVEIGAS